MLDGIEIDICRPAEGAQAELSRSTRLSKAGSSRPPMPAPGRICRRRPSICPSGRGNWLVAQSLCFSTSPEREDTILVQNPFEA